MSKKIAAAGLVTIIVGLLVTNQMKQKAPLRVVPSVDLERYQGVWYEIARLPNRFEEICASDVTAQYTPLSAGRVEVVNRCRKKDGQMTEARGIARPAEDSRENSRLEVRFAPDFLSFLPFVWGDYQIMELAPDYSYALVGEPARKYLWILSRTPQMEEATYRKLVEEAAAQGFDVSQLIRTKQN